MGLDFVSGQFGCLFSRCRKYVINSLIHGHFHIGLFIIHWLILALDCVSGQYEGLGMITRPIWKCPCSNLYLYKGSKQDRQLGYLWLCEINISYNNNYIILELLISNINISNRKNEVLIFWHGFTEVAKRLIYYYLAIYESSLTLNLY